MDFSLLFDPEYLPIIVGTIVGFGLLAAALLIPVYRFLEREQQVAQKWTPDALAERLKQRRSADATEMGEGDDGSATSNGLPNESNAAS